MEKKEKYYTYTTNTTGTSDYNTDPDSFTNIKTDNSAFNQYNFGCAYLLPCGICERTNKQCPKYWQYESPITWDKWTCSVENISNVSKSVDENLNYTTDSSSSFTCDYCTEFDNKK